MGDKSSQPPTSEKTTLTNADKGEVLKRLKQTDEQKKEAPLTDYRLEKLDFSGHTFDHSVDFSEAELVDCSFEKTIFKEKANFGQARSSEILQFNEEINLRQIALWLGKAQFHGKANFRKAQFNGEVNFTYTEFNGEADFRGSQFNAEAHFVQTRFNKVARFGRAQFIKQVHFDKTHFNNYTNFEGTDFNGEADFREAQFSQSSSFVNAHFKGDAYFWRTQFCWRVGFAGVEFHGKVRFWGDEANQVISEEADFSRCEFKWPEEVMFQQVYLGQASFLDATNLERINFLWVVWGKKGHLFWKRNFLFDEEEAKDRRIWEVVEDLYRQLKLNYEHKGDYARAGDFHYGEMEMRRNAMGRGKIKIMALILELFVGWIPRHLFSLTVWYKYLAGYGEKWGQALVCLVVLFLLFGGVNMLSGLQNEKGKVLFNYKFIDNYEVLLQKEFWQNEEFWKDYSTALHYTFFRMTLRLDPKLLPIPHDDLIWTVLQSISGPILIALLALAVKRKFKR